MKKSKTKFLSIVYVKIYSDFNSTVVLEVVLPKNLDKDNVVKETLLFVKNMLLDQKNKLNLPYNILSLKKLCKNLNKVPINTETTLSFFADQILYSENIEGVFNSISFDAYGKKLYRFVNPKRIDSIEKILIDICPTFNKTYKTFSIDPDCDLVQTLDEDNRFYNKSFSYLK